MGRSITSIKCIKTGSFYLKLLLRFEVVVFCSFSVYLFGLLVFFLLLNVGQEDNDAT